MFSILKNRFGTPGVIAVIALVFAMVGGAYAAGGGLSGKQKKEVKAIAKSFAGKPGAAGAAGAQGPIGPAGPKGDAGAPGKDGTSVTSKAIPTSSATCNKQGGTEFTSISGTEHVCNGQTGFSDTLPGGKTMMGVWGTSGAEVIESITTTTGEFAKPGGGEGAAVTSVTPEGSPSLSMVAINFPFQLSVAPELYFMVPGEAFAYHFDSSGALKGFLETEEEVDTVCPGNAQTPKAEAGDLCVYSAQFDSVQYDAFGSGVQDPTHTFGATFPLLMQSHESPRATGTWAVKAP